MDLTQIKAAYVAEIVNKCSHYFIVINEDMIDSYKEIERTKQIIITENRMARGYNFNSHYKQDIVKEIKQHYSDNWDVAYIEATKKDNAYFIFAYKGEPAAPPNIVLRDIIIANTEETEKEMISRTEILDIRNEP